MWPKRGIRRTRTGVASLYELQDRYGERVWPHAVPMDTRLRDAASLTRAEPPDGRGADMYRRALKWLLETEAGGDQRKEAA